MKEGKAPRYVPNEDIYDYNDPTKLLFKTTREYPLLHDTLNPWVKDEIGTDTFFIDEQEDDHYVQEEYVMVNFTKVYDGEEEI